MRKMTVGELRKFERRFLALGRAHAAKISVPPSKPRVRVKALSRPHREENPR